MQETDIIRALQTKANNGEVEKLAKGLVYGILCGLDWSRYLLCSHYMLPTSCTTLSSLSPLLKFRGNVLSLFTKLWKLNCTGFNDLFLTFLRSYDIINEIKPELDWVKNSSFLALVFYKVTRLASISANDGSTALSDYTYIMSNLWRSRRDVCLSIGRDLMRVISPLSEVTGLEVIWNDLFSPSRDGVPHYWALLCTPTHPKFHSVLLSPQLESKLVYIIEKATPYNYTRYLKWIIEEYDEGILPDIVRFVVTFPSNMESTPRWQITAWFLTCSTNHQTQANIKQALIFDCLFYNQLDKLHTIEPLMSILKYSISRFSQLAEEILEFLLSSAELYDKRSVAGMMRSLKECFSIAYHNRIAPSLESLISEEKIDCGIRSRISDLFDTSGSSSEPSQSPIYDEDTPPNTPPRPYEILGEIASDFATDPSFEKLEQIVEKNAITKEMGAYVLKCIAHEFVVPITTELQRNAVFYQIFSTAAQDEKMLELLKILVSIDSAVGIRLLIFSIQTKSNLYFKFENTLERDLAAGSEETSLDTLNWIYPYLLNKQCFTPKILLQFLSTATPELFYHTEVELRSNKYKLLTGNLEEILILSVGISCTEKIYLWRLIAAEIQPQLITCLVDNCTKHFSAENCSGLLHYLRVHHKSIKADTVTAILSLPVYLAGTVAAALAKVDTVIVIST